MIILNNTFIIHHSIDHEVLSWISGVFCKSAVRHGALPDRTLLTKVLGGVVDDNGDAESTDGSSDDVTYALHLCFPDMHSAVEWNDHHASKLFDLIRQKYPSKVYKFHTYLLVIA